MGAPADEAPRAARRWLLRGARNRIVAAFIVLLAFSTLLSLLAIQQLLVVRADNRVSARLVREVEEFRRVTQGRNPESGEPWGTNLEGIFGQYFRRNVRRHGTMSLAFLDGELFDSSGRIGGGAPTSAQLGRWARVTRSETGELEMGSDTVRYRAVPVRGRRGVRGAFVVAASLTFERDEANDAVRLAAWFWCRCSSSRPRWPGWGFLSKRILTDVSRFAYRAAEASGA